MYDAESPDEDELIDEVLGENPRASQLRLMRAALSERRTAFLEELERTEDDSERARLGARIRTLEKQIDALRQEEGITEFVENSVRVTARKAAIDEDE